MKVELFDNSEAWIKNQESHLQAGLDKMANSIKVNAQMVTPRLNNRLVNTARVEGSGNERIIIFGKEGVPYAHAQEVGTNGRVVFRNYTAPGTGAHFLENTGNKIVKEGIKKWLS